MLGQTAIRKDKEAILNESGIEQTSFIRTL